MQRYTHACLRNTCVYGRSYSDHNNCTLRPTSPREQLLARYQRSRDPPCEFLRSDIPTKVISKMKGSEAKKNAVTLERGRRTTLHRNGMVYTCTYTCYSDTVPPRGNGGLDSPLPATYPRTDYYQSISITQHKCFLPDMSSARDARRGGCRGALNAWIITDVSCLFGQMQPWFNIKASMITGWSPWSIHFPIGAMVVLVEPEKLVPTTD